jgi:4-alpha-glucanotransferase
MNTPSTVKGNWTWKLTDYDGLKENADWLRGLMIMYGRRKDPEEELELEENAPRPQRLDTL